MSDYSQSLLKKIYPQMLFKNVWAAKPDFLTLRGIEAPAKGRKDAT
jgi:hypothetical protein